MRSLGRTVFLLLFFLLSFLTMPAWLLAAQINSVTSVLVDTNICYNFYYGTETCCYKFDIKVSATGNFCREVGGPGCYFQELLSLFPYYEWPNGGRVSAGFTGLDHERKIDPPCNLPSGSTLCPERKGEFSFFVSFPAIDVAGITYRVGIYAYPGGVTSPVATTILQVPSGPQSGCGACDVSINASPSEVWPKGAGNDDKTTSTIMVTATNPPPEGCTVNFKVEPVENSGGHSHGGNRPKGTVTPTTLTIPAGSLEPVYALYSSSDVSGQEKIIVEVNGSKADEKMVEVKVPDLMPLDSLSWYNLTGSTSSHSANHYGTNSTKVAVYNMASDYWNEALVRLGINDMSLPWGGLFDINGNWSSSPGHSLHRTGESVDIDRCADGVLVDQELLDKIALRYDGERTVEDALKPPPCAGPADTPRIHYDFSE